MICAFYQGLLPSSIFSVAVHHSHHRSGGQQLLDVRLLSFAFPQDDVIIEPQEHHHLEVEVPLMPGSSPS